MNDEFLKLENQLCYAVYSASLAFNKVYRPLLRQLGITYPQYLAMLVLWEKKVATVSELCSALGLDTGTLSPLLKRLEKTGYIERRRNSTDERQVDVILTGEGLACRKKAMEIVTTIGKATGCSESSFRDILDRLKTLRGNLDYFSRSQNDDTGAVADA